MPYIIFPLRYIFLKKENDWRLLWRDVLAAIFITCAISVPFIAIPKANYFGVSGFLDRIGGFSSVLTGFYVAALVAVATFSLHGDLDGKIQSGKIYYLERDSQEKIWISRREFVCYIFGYLSFISLSLSVISILVVVIAQPASKLLGELLKDTTNPNVATGWIPGIMLILINILLAHLIITTCRGLIYLIDRLYHRNPVITSGSRSRPKLPATADDTSDDH